MNITGFNIEGVKIIDDLIEYRTQLFMQIGINNLSCFLEQNIHINGLRILLILLGEFSINMLKIPGIN